MEKKWKDQKDFNGISLKKPKTVIADCTLLFMTSSTFPFVSSYMYLYYQMGTYVLIIDFMFCFIAFFFQNQLSNALW